MTESEWEQCAEPLRLMARLPLAESPRKSRLFAAACCRNIWHYLSDERLRDAVSTVEQFADGIVGADAVREARAKVEAMSSGAGRPEKLATIMLTAVPEDNGEPASGIAYHTGIWAAKADGATVKYNPADHHGLYADIGQCDVLRDLFPNPLRPSINQHPEYRPSTLELARSIYGDRAYDRLPELAGHLAREGCDDVVLLAHCRGSARHYRGCWALDLLLGKS